MKMTKIPSDQLKTDMEIHLNISMLKKLKTMVKKSIDPIAKF